MVSSHALSSLKVNTTSFAQTMHWSQWNSTWKSHKVITIYIFTICKSKLVWRFLLSESILFQVHWVVVLLNFEIVYTIPNHLFDVSIVIKIRTLSHFCFVFYLFLPCMARQAMTYATILTYQFLVMFNKGPSPSLSIATLLHPPFIMTCWQFLHSVVLTPSKKYIEIFTYMTCFFTQLW